MIQARLRLEIVPTRLNVSSETIRRDLDMLQSEGKLVKIYGGAVKKSNSIFEAPYQPRSLLNKEAKRKIGKTAAKMIQDNDSIIIDVGTTAIEICKALQGLNNITVLSPSIAAINILIKKMNNNEISGKIISLGGSINETEMSVYGSTAQEQLENMYFDKAFIACSAISKFGIHAYDINDRDLSSSIIKQASQAYVLADDSKFEEKSLYKLCNFHEITGIITNIEHISAELLEVMDEKGLKNNKIIETMINDFNL